MVFISNSMCFLTKNIENGFLMCLWYSTLTRLVGSGVSTYIVLAKCGLDQLFFATQQDGIFLTLCAFQKTEHLEAVFAKVKKNFLTTWLNDCSVMPIVNFVGFAWVPSVLLPTYMSLIQLFWQVYVSSVAAGADNDDCDTLDDDVDSNIGTFFDPNPVIVSTAKSITTNINTTASDAKRKSESKNNIENIIEQQNQDLKMSQSQLQIVPSSSSTSNNSNTSPINELNNAMNSSSNSKSFRKGAMKALWRWEENLIKTASLSSSSATNFSISHPAISSLTVVPSSSTSLTSSSTSFSSPNSISSHSQSLPSPSPVIIFTETSRASHADESSQNSSGFSDSVKHVFEALDASEKLVARQLDEQWHQDRSTALNNAKIGGSLLFVAALVRKLVFKI